MRPPEAGGSAEGWKSGSRVDPEWITVDASSCFRQD